MYYFITHIYYFLGSPSFLFTTFSPVLLCNMPLFALPPIFLLIYSLHIVIINDSGIPCRKRLDQESRLSRYIVPREAATWLEALLRDAEG